ncbi:MAG TPA: PGPGW domain-containing protein [Polyangiales bacterium]|nr:PGPGW domain-containing protein [Polyangiales bacterium]
MANPEKIVPEGPNGARGVVRVAKVTVGFALLPVGVALLVLPGPGLPVVALSLMLLEGEFSWAGKARVGMTDLGKRGFDWVRERASR